MTIDWAKPLDVVDAQLHLDRASIAATLSAMDALGIASVLVDEFWHVWVGTHPTHIMPGHALANGAWRAACPTAQEASILHPHRFAYVLRIDPRDPDLESVMRVAGSSPHARAFRVQPVWTAEEAASFADGSYDALFDLAQGIGLPVALFIPGHVELLRPYAMRYPKLRLVIDHCGMGYAEFPPGRSADEVRRVTDPRYFDEVLKLADLPNVALKWSHAQDRFGVEVYPYEGLRPHLRRAIAAFGADRLMWASDKTVIQGHSWSDLLHAVRDDPELSGEEKAWLLGRTARTVFDWASPADPFVPVADTGNAAT